MNISLKISENLVRFNGSYKAAKHRAGAVRDFALDSAYAASTGSNRPSAAHVKLYEAEIEAMIADGRLRITEVHKPAVAYMEITAGAV